MVGHFFQIFQLVKPRGVGALHVVEQGLDQRADGQVFVPRMEKQRVGRREHTAVRLALAATDALGNACGQSFQGIVLQNARLQLQEVEGCTFIPT